MRNKLLPRLLMGAGLITSSLYNVGCGGFSVRQHAQSDRSHDTEQEQEQD